MIMERLEVTAMNDGRYFKISDDLVVYAIWHPVRQYWVTIRKLTPRECYRLQAFPDDYFDRASLLCSDHQLYKQSGNSVTVDAVEALARKMA